MRFEVLLFGVVVLWLGGSGVLAAERLSAEGPPDAHSSRDALDWDGRYIGRLPCADCEAIETQLTLSLDGRYVLKTRYLGRSEDWRHEAGRFGWDERGQVVRLQDGAEAKAFFVGENRLWQLDQSGQRIQGAMAELYQLHKMPVEQEEQAEQDAADAMLASASLFAQPWRLTALNGQPVVGQESPIYMQFVEAEQRVQGFSGCNRFFGNLSMAEAKADATTGVALTFSNIGMTRMACDGETQESPFMQALQETRSMRFTGADLVLLDASGEALALFAADESLKPKE